MFEINEILTTKNAKMNFLKGLIRLAKSDGKDDVSERVYFKNAALSMGLSDVEVDSLEEFWESNEKIELDFEKSEEKMFFLIQAVQLCWIDGGYVESEKLEMRDIISEIGITQDALDKVEEWAYEGICWNNKGQDLLELK